MTRLGARDLLDRVLDPGTWQNWDVTPQQVAVPGSPYAEELVTAAAKAGTDEARSGWMLMSLTNMLIALRVQQAG
jgi:acetyl-CoA carboxylase beta subunit